MHNKIEVSSLLEMEKTVIGTMIADNDSIDHVMRELEPKSFYKNAHSIIFEIAVDMYQDVKPVTPITLLSEIQQTEHAKKISASYLASFTEHAKTASTVQYYINQVNRHYRKRNCIRIAKKYVADVESGADPDKEFVDLFIYRFY